MLIILFFSLSSCSNQTITKNDLINVATSSAGAYLGYQWSDADIFTTILGSTAGLIVGDYINKFLDKNDYYYYKNATLNALESNNIGKSSFWNNVKTGNKGVVLVKSYFKLPECRLIEHIYIKKGKSKSFYDTACREDNGSWSIIR